MRNASKMPYVARLFLQRRNGAELPRPLYEMPADVVYELLMLQQELGDV